MFQINTASGVPIYEQLSHNVTRLTDSGVLKPHDRLPSVRSLAVELGINPNTVAKAYRELETRGFIYSVYGKGSFVAERAGENVTVQQMAVLQSFRSAVQQAYKERLSAAQLKQIIDSIYEGGRQHD